MLPVIGPLRPWGDLATVAIGRLPMRTSFVPDAPPGSTPWSIDLAGTWSFRRFVDPDRVPASAVGAGDPATSWQEISVPGTWVLHADTPDVPHYTNVAMPFDGPPPALPDVNPTGVYRTTFTTPRAWRGRQVVLHVGGAHSVHAVYVDGTFVGYGTDAHLASEYDLTPHLADGPEHHLAIVVVRYSAQSYVEDQDRWWWAGLHRGVHVEARAPVRLGDVNVVADWDGEAGQLSLDVHVASVSGTVPSGWTVRAWCEHLTGRRCSSVSDGGVPSHHDWAYVFEGHRVRLAAEVTDTRPWSAESPHRERVVVELVDPDGTVADTVSTLVGFRRVEVRDRQLLVSGAPITVFGMNRHDHHPDRGPAVTRDDILADLLAMKRLNVNAVRTAHYPNHPWLYDLCDELGLYVFDEANIESHGYNTSLVHDPRARATWMERVARMVQRDRNHPSVVVWSLGNESGLGAVHDAAAAWIRRDDPTRPVHYEGAVFHENWVDGGRTASDLVCPMYPPIDTIVAYGERGEGDRPLVMCEYSHAMGNSNGSLADYWDAIDADRTLQGGFLWEWKDHGIRQRLADGGERFAYGGQFGDHPNDGNFVADGVMASDLTPHPAACEVAWVHRPVSVDRLVGRDRVRVRNRRAFVDLSDLRGTVEVLVDGRMTTTARFDADVAPGTSTFVALPEKVLAALAAAEGETWLSFRWVQRRSMPWAPAGHLVAWDQLRVRAGKLPVPAPRKRRTRPLDVASVLDTLPTLSLWRAPVDNDGFKLQPVAGDGVEYGPALWRWLTYGLDRGGLDDGNPDHRVVHRQQSTVDDDGSVVFDHVVDVPEALADLPRVGAMFTLPVGFDEVVWYGRGPHECYPDRERSAMLGTWSAPVDDLPYLVPQEYGLRTDCRWMTISDGPRTVAVEPLRPRALHLGVTRYTSAQLFAAADWTELPAEQSRVVHLDVAHRGLGTASCGPDVLNRYRIASGRYRFRYRLRAWTT